MRCRRPAEKWARSLHKGHNNLNFLWFYKKLFAVVFRVLFETKKSLFFLTKSVIPVLAVTNSIGVHQTRESTNWNIDGIANRLPLSNSQCRYQKRRAPKCLATLFISGAVKVCLINVGVVAEVKITLRPKCEKTTKLHLTKNKNR